MIYETARFRPGGDRAIEVELGDEMSFRLNFMVHTLAASIRSGAVTGVIELIPELASLQVSYDPDQVGYDDLVVEISRLHASLAGEDGGELPSRLFTVPVLYFDPWTSECINDYRTRVTDKPMDPDLVADLNGLPDRASLRRLHASTEYWVAALGFWPGLCSLMPLDDRARLIAPKYNPPRTWTPKGTIGIGGALTCIYPDNTPGGYQLLGRTPMPIFDRDQRLKAFRETLALFRPGDRVRFVPVDLEEFEWIAARVEDGTYEHDCVDYQVFSVARYDAWLTATVGASRTGG
jgi:urea carboxylase